VRVVDTRLLLGRDGLLALEIEIHASTTCNMYSIMTERDVLQQCVYRAGFLERPSFVYFKRAA
jgi:hypothetical protein